MERVLLWALVTCSMSVGAWSTMEVLRLRDSLRNIYCDARDSVTAEREFTYPIFRALGHRPEDYAKNVRNPLITPTGRYLVGPEDCRR
jgi:hypothetical protein